jgi:hypothetical protein
MKTTFVILALCIASSAVAKVQFADEAKDVLQAAIDQRHSVIRAQMEAEDAAMSEDLDKILVGSTKFMCTNGKDPEAISRQEYVTEFKKGPCNPVTILPGIGGSKLRVEINCQKFKAANPSGFSDCGWKRCIGLQTPKKEYKIWIAAALAPMSIVVDSDKSRRCFNAIFGFDSTNIARGELKSFPGLTVKIEGTTAESMSKNASNCASFAIEDLLTTGSQVNGSAYFKKHRLAFEEAGYLTGLTYQALPYDFRLDYHTNELSNGRFLGLIKEMHDNFAKKVVIFAHSFGNLQTVHNLNKMTQLEKDTYIARYIALAPPYLGSPKTVEGQIGLDNTFAQDLGFAEVGVTPNMYRHTIGLLKGMFNLMPKDTFNYFRSTDWMKAVFKRMDAEHHGTTVTTGTVVDMFPQPNESCLPGFKSRDEFCTLGLVDMTEFGKVDGDTITTQNIGEIFKKYAVVEHSDKVLEAV